MCNSSLSLEQCCIVMGYFFVSIMIDSRQGLVAREALLPDFFQCFSSKVTLADSCWALLAVLPSVYSSCLLLLTFGFGFVELRRPYFVGFCNFESLKCMGLSKPCFYWVISAWTCGEGMKRKTLLLCSPPRKEGSRSKARFFVISLLTHSVGFSLTVISVLLAFGPGALPFFVASF